jgi:sugar diacid utilization regulator
MYDMFANGEDGIMDLSLRLLLSELGLDLESPFIKNPSFVGFELFLPGNTDYSGQILYISKLSEALIPTKKDNMFFLCIRDRSQDECESISTLKNICIIKKNMDIKELTNAVQRVFNRLQNWVINMHESVLANRGLQDLMNLSEPIFGNHISVLDASFNLLACTKNIETDDYTLVRLMENGYHPEETIHRFLKYRRIEQFETADENVLIVSRDHVMSDYDTIKKVYKHNGQFFAIVTMVCCNREYSDVMEELYKLLLRSITLYFEKEQPLYIKSKQYESFLGELIRKTIHSEKDAENRAKALNLPFEGQFQVYLIVFNDILNIPSSRLAHDLTLRLNNSNAIVYNRDLLILCRITGSEDEVEARRKQIASVFSDLNCNCGVSNVFETLWNIASAYAQAHAAVIIGERLRMAKKEDSKFCFYCYEDYYLHHLVANCIDTMPDAFTSSFAFRAIKTLKLYGEKHNVDFLKTLSAYIECESNATKSSEQLHMHRNTVLYHIRKVEDILGVSLDNAVVRMKLVAGLKAYELDRV